MVYRGIIGFIRTPASGLDADVQAFLTATGITDSTTITALSTLVAGLKSDVIWSKMYAIYPMLGASKATCKYNLKDPRDLDAAYRIVWVEVINSVVFRPYTNGAIYANGPGAYGNTKFASAFNTNSGSAGVWLSQLNGGANGYDFGARTTSPTDKGTWMASHWGDDQCYSDVTGGGGGHIAWSSVSGGGTSQFIQVNRTSSTNTYQQIGTFRASYSSSTFHSSTDELYVLGANVNGSNSSAGRYTLFAYIGDTLTTTDMDNYNTRVSQFMTDLGTRV